MVLIETSFEGGNDLRISFPDDSGCESFVVPRNPTAEDLKSWTILPKITLWPTHPPVDGYVCGTPTSSSGTVSEELSRYFGTSVHLVFKGPEARRIDPTASFPDLEAYAKFQDMYPLLILSEESTDVIEQEMKQYVGQQGIDDQWRAGKIAIERFRPNIILKGGGPFAEDKWEEISIGSETSPVLTLVSKCTRCLLPNVSPETGERDKAVPYKVLMKFRTGLDPQEKMKPCVGCNAVPAGEGELRIGDRVYIKKRI
ncbi:MOSC domain-containing protein [Panaeolus papilionaceus]|nr:MOSC domain-containing protein [Panaeolus papilionaceus]